MALWLLVALKDLLLIQCQILPKIKSDRVRNFLMAVTEKDMCNFGARFLIQFFLEICICAFINVARLSDESTWSSRISITAVSIVCLFTLFVISRIWIGAPEWNKLETITNPRYKTIYLGLYMKYTTVATMYPIMFLLRRIIYAVVALFMSEYPLCQVLLYILMSCFMITLLWQGQPFEDKRTMLRL